MNYTYSTINPKENKQLYMYSDYYGIELIEAYKHSRNKVIKKCLDDLKTIKDKKESVDTLFRSSGHNKAEQEESMQFFKNLLKNKFNLLQKNSTKSELNKTIDDLDYLFYQVLKNKILDKWRIDNLVKKFEIKKSFSTEIKYSYLNDPFHQDIDETYHLLFSFIISKYFILTNSFKYLSVLLKLNDLLIYRFDNENFLNTDLLSCSILSELKIFYKLEKAMLGN